MANTRVSPEAFEQISNWLKKEGYESIFVSDLSKYKNKKLKFPSKTIMISFDDGYEDNFLYAFPLLKKYDFKATIFIITSKISTDPSNGYLSWAQLKEMVQSNYVEIQSHSHTHSYCYTSIKLRLSTPRSFGFYWASYTFTGPDSRWI